MVENPKENAYSAQLQKLLGPTYQVHNLGVNGLALLKTADNSYWNHPNFKISRDLKPQIVLIMLGTNDSKIENWTNMQDYLACYEEMAHYYQSLPSKPRVYILTSPALYPVSEKGEIAFNMQKEVVEEMSQELVKFGQDHQIPVVDIHEVTLNHPEYFPVDGVHTNAEGAGVIAQAVYETLVESH